MTKEEAKYFPWLRGSVAKTKCNFDQCSSVAKWLSVAIFLLGSMAKEEAHYLPLAPWLRGYKQVYYLAPWLRGSVTKEAAKYFPWLRGSVAKTKCNFDQYSSVAKWLYFSLDQWLKKKHNIYPWLRGSVAKNKSNVCTPGSVALWLKKR